MLERIWCWSKVTLLSAMFLLPVFAAQWRRDINDWWRSNHRLEPSEEQRLAQSEWESVPADGQLQHRHDETLRSTPPRQEPHQQCAAEPRE